MGHLVGKDVYRRLGKKIDELTMRAPWNDTLYAILKELYTQDDAELVVRMPYNFSTLARIERLTGVPEVGLLHRLESLCSRGLVMDICINDVSYYVPSPMMLGIFEFTMMRTAGGFDHEKVARLFHAYFDEGSYQRENYGQGQRMPSMRAVPHTSAPADGSVEILDHEKAEAILDASRRFAMGVCGCRHAKHHTGEVCDNPLDNCSSLGGPLVDYVVRNGLAREVSKTEMRENVARSRELGLVLSVDNVKRNVNILCHCCSCCCHMIQGITKSGYTNIIVSSGFVARPDLHLCRGCTTCSKRCPIQAISRVKDADPRFAAHGRPQVDASACLGCGVCATFCPTRAMGLHKREQRVFHPEMTFERTILQCLERGTLQNQLFDDPGSKSQSFLRAAVGGFLRLPPVKQVLMSEAVRSRFLEWVRRAAVRRGMQVLTEI